MSAATQSDEYFCLQIQACWGLGPAVAASAASTAALHPTTAADAAAGENTVRFSGDYDSSYARRTYSKARTSAPPGVLPGTAGRCDKAAAVGRAGARSTAGRTPTAGVAAILRQLGAEVQGHGAAWGLAGLRRALLNADRYMYDFGQLYMHENFTAGALLGEGWGGFGCGGCFGEEYVEFLVLWS